jgi:acetyl esterase
VDLPTILLIHGGAFVAGSVDTHDNLARYLCYKVQAIVVSVDYRVAPEGKFPFALEQCYDVLISIQHAPKIAVVGDSAGGNMAAALCLMSRDRCGPKIDLQVLINPAPDLTCNGTILRQNDPLDVLRLQAFHYLADPKDANHPYVSPLIATSLKELPEAVVILAEKDELYEMGLSYANRLQEAKIPTEVYCQKGIGHLAGHGARAAPQAQESLDIAVDRIKNIFRR